MAQYQITVNRELLHQLFLGNNAIVNTKVIHMTV